jgi:hypothetical protein
MNSTVKLPNESDPPNWFTFVESFSSFLGVFPFIPHEPAPPRARWSLGATYKQTIENYKRAETPFVPQIEDVIRRSVTPAARRHDLKQWPTSLGYGLSYCHLYCQSSRFGLVLIRMLRSFHFPPCRHPMSCNGS